MLFTILLSQRNQDALNFPIYPFNELGIFKSLFLPRVAEFIYIEGDNKRVVSSNFIYNELGINDENADKTIIIQLLCVKQIQIWIQNERSSLMFQQNSLPRK